MVARLSHSQVNTLTCPAVFDMDGEDVECHRPTHTGGYCNAHYQQRRKAGKFTRPRGYYAICRFPACGRDINSRGWCHSHYEQWRNGYRMQPIGERSGPRHHARKFTAEGKLCAWCDTFLPLGSFDKFLGTGYPRQYCKDCTRAKRFGLTRQRYDEIVGNGDCNICGQPEPASRRHTIDHDHSCCEQGARSCGECVRGYLCHPCNQALGKAKDSPDTLRAMADYVERGGVR